VACVIPGREGHDFSPAHNLHFVPILSQVISQSSDSISVDLFLSSEVSTICQNSFIKELVEEGNTECSL
jgi:hypothetical protein